ncbi:MAG: hypothetical protein WA364_24160 [Candidatus Nitrosopolaris sp.]
MKNTKQISQDVAWEPFPVRNPVERGYPVKDGVNLPNSLTEDIGGFSLCPMYSNMQLRKIRRLERTGKGKANQSYERIPRCSSAKIRKEHQPNCNNMLVRSFVEEVRMMCVARGGD